MTAPHPAPRTAPRPALVACMRNEGVFVLEWLAHHSALGFAEIIVVTNDCTDGSDTLLDRLAELGRVTHIRQDVPPDTAPQDSGMDLALAHARATGLTHLLHIDSDEFLALPEGTLADLLDRTEAADVVPIPWRMFGDSGVTHWTPGDLVTQRNTRAEPATEPGRTKFKCLFRVASFARATDHNPLEPQVADPLVLTPDGAELSNRSLYQAKSARFRPHELAAGARAAQLYHYAVRSEDCFLMKNDRGDGQGKADGGKYHLGSRWHREANRNEVEARALADQAPALQARLADWRSDPPTAALEAACGAWFETRRDTFLTPDRRAALARKRPR
ncbi:glycosyltransferase family 2 protein [Ferrimonas balearica]|nr:glycosyltransferase family 2 protein [Ferrimonas balearica]